MVCSESVKSLVIGVQSLSRVNSLQPRGLQHTRLFCPSLSPGVCSNSHALSQWCHLILFHPLCLFLSVFPRIRVFSIELVFTLGGQSIGALASVLPMNSQRWFPLRLTGLISLQSKRLSRVFSSTTVWKTSVLLCSASFMVQLSYLYMTIGKTIALTIWTFVNKVMSLLFNMLSRFVIAFLPKSKSFNLMAAVTVCSDFRAKIPNFSPCRTPDILVHVGA